MERRHPVGTDQREQSKRFNFASRFGLIETLLNVPRVQCRTRCRHSVKRQILFVCLLWCLIKINVWNCRYSECKLTER